MSSDNSVSRASDFYSEGPGFKSLFGAYYLRAVLAQAVKALGCGSSPKTTIFPLLSQPKQDHVE